MICVFAFRFRNWSRKKEIVCFEIAGRVFRVKFIIWYRAVGEAGRVVWEIGESEVSVADGGPRCFGVHHLRWGSRQSHRGIRSSRISTRVSKDQSLPFAAQIHQKNLSSPVNGFLKILCAFCFDVCRAGGRWSLPPSDLSAGTVPEISRKDSSVWLPRPWKP